MNPLSWLVVQMSPLVTPRSFGKLGLEVAQSKFLTNEGDGVRSAYCDPGSTFVPCAGGLRYAISRMCVDVADVEEAQAGGEAAAGGDLRVVHVVDVAVVAGEAEAAMEVPRAGRSAWSRPCVQFAGSWMSSWSLRDGGRLRRIADVDQPRETGGGLALPHIRSARRRTRRLKRMYGLPLMVIGSAFCAPTLPSSQRDLADDAVRRVRLARPGSR